MKTTDTTAIEADERRVRRYPLADGFQAVVGRTDQDNEYVSFRLARANDLWFHVHGMPGSHVIVPLRDGRQPGREVIRQAAAIAAYHSKARNAGQVPVTMTRAGNVKKPRGAKTGTVRVSGERLIRVRPGLPGAA